jgi:cytochrome c
MNTMEVTKIVAALCASLLIFLGVRYFIAEPMYHVGGGHGGTEPAYLVAVTATEEAAPAGVDYAALLAAADPAAGEKDFGKCKACHKIEAGANATGPSLFAVTGRDIASVAGFSYSGALVALDGGWTPERLAEFLHAPKVFAKGTRMTFLGFRNPADAAAMAAYLGTLK